VGKVFILKQEGRQIFGAVASSITSDQVGLKEKGRNHKRHRRLTLNAVVKGASNDGEITLVEREKAILYVAVSRSRAQIQNLKVVMPVHANSVIVVDR
jgi:hypothetical protein